MKNSVTVALITISVLAIGLIAWLAWQTIGSGAIIIIALVLGTGLISGLFNILGARLVKN